MAELRRPPRDGPTARVIGCLPEGVLRRREVHVRLVVRRRLAARLRHVCFEVRCDEARQPPRTHEVYCRSALGHVRPHAAVLGSTRRSATPSTTSSEDASQSQVYRVVAAPLVGSLLRGINACILAYGQTGAGKTHTTFGPDIDPTTPPNASQLGVLPRTIHELFERLRATQLTEHVVRVSYFQLYLDTHLQDLQRVGLGALQTRRDPETGVDGARFTHHPEGLQLDGTIAEQCVCAAAPRHSGSIESIKRKKSEQSSRNGCLDRVQYTPS